MTKKPDKKKIDTLEKGLRNLSEHENLPVRLRKMEKKIEKVECLSLITWLGLIIFLILFIVFGGVFQ